MTTNLIQNYISASKTLPQQPKMQGQNVQSTQKPKPDFDIERELNNRTFIKPLPSKGRLLNGNIFNAPAIMVKDAVYDVKAFKHAMQGNANDHELGKLNDVGLKLGGLAIAGYLFTKKQTPVTKGMEFVGLGSFLASMAIWPKLAIQLPAYLIHGVNVQKQYEDSFGRKKSFYQDPQFIPWDLYSDKEIDKMGNRLRVPKDIPNRRDAIQEKMKKIAIQNNTLLMLTAGFATPVMSALICNQTEPYLAKWLNNRKNKKADLILTNLDEHSKKYDTHNATNNIENQIKLHAGKPITEEVINSVADAFEGMDSVTAESFKADLRELMTSNTHTISKDSTKAISKNLKDIFKGKPISKDAVDAIIPNENNMFNIFKENNFIKTDADDKALKAISDKILLAIKKNVETYNQNRPEAEQLDFEYIKKLIRSHKVNEHPIKSVLNNSTSATFSQEIQANLRNIAKAFDAFNAKTNALNEYAVTKVGSAPETVIANYWNNISKDLLTTLGISPKEIEKVRFDRNLTGELLRNKIESIVSDDATYKKVMKDLVAKVASLDSEIKPSDITTYNEKVDTLFNEFGEFLKDKQFSNTAKAIAGVNNNDNVGTLKNIQKSFVSERLSGVKSSFYRLINTLDFYRRIAKNVNSIDILKQYPREVREELIELCKIITLQGHSSDNATKFYMLRNPHPSDDMSDIVVKNGKIENKYFGKGAVNTTTDIPNDKFFYQRAMQLMFGDKMDKETTEILEGSIIKPNVTEYRENVVKIIGGENYFAKPRHRISPVNDAGSEFKFLLTGIAPDELFFKAGQQAFNTRKWLKIFGAFGGVLLGVTVLAQFFFGKMPDKKAGKK